MEKFETINHDKKVFTTGAFIAPVKITGEDGTERFQWLVTGFEDDTFQDGKCIDPCAAGKTIEKLIDRTDVLLHETREMRFEDFYEKYKPITNEIEPTDTYDGFFFDTMGAEFDFVNSAITNTVWTIVDGEDGDAMLLPGFHTCNRIGYMVTEVPYGDSDICGLEVRI